MVESDHKWFYGSGFVNLDNVTGSSVRFTVDSPSADGRRRQRYDRPKGTVVPGTASWDSWELLIVPVSLNAGNTVTLTATTANGGPNLDRILIGAVS